MCLIYKKFDWREDWFKILRSNKNFPLSTNSLFKFVVQFIRSKNKISPMYGGNSYHRGKSTWTLDCGFWCEAVLGKYMCHSQICSISESVAYWFWCETSKRQSYTGLYLNIVAKTAANYSFFLLIILVQKKRTFSLSAEPESEISATSSICKVSNG